MIGLCFGTGFIGMMVKNLCLGTRITESIAGTRTTTGLELHAWLDKKTFDKWRQITDKQLAECMIYRNEHHGK